MTATNDGESMLPSKIPFWCLIFDQKVVTEEVMQYSYTGLGTEDDPYAIVWIPEDPRNPMNFRPIKKWSISLLVSFATLAVSLVSSAFSGGMRQIMEDFGASQEIVILGVSLFVLGFAIGPLIWAPLSEIFGRRQIFYHLFFVSDCVQCWRSGCNEHRDTHYIAIPSRFFWIFTIWQWTRHYCGHVPSFSTWYRY